MFYLNEELEENNFPVFILFVEGKIPILSQGIKFVTKSSLSHVAISFDPTLLEIYSFNIRHGNDGFLKENLFMYKNARIELYVFFTDEKTYKKLKRSFNDFKRHKSETSFSIKRLLLKILHQGKEKDKYKQVCSSFVQTILKDAGIMLVDDRNIKLVAPGELYTGVIKNNTIYPLYNGNSLDYDALEIKHKLNKLMNNSSTNMYRNAITLNESLSPEDVNRSNYCHFILFNLFDIYTTNDNLQTDGTFIKNMRWVKNQLEEISKEANWELKPFEITLCNSFEDLDEFYNHEAPKWVTGFTYGGKIYMKAPNIYKGELYYNIVLHESIHVLIYNNLTLKNKKISIKRNEGMAVFFSTPLNKWLKELNHNGANWYYYESAIDVQEDYINGGMKLVIKKSV